jgi:hypothetical protein
MVMNVVTLFQPTDGNTMANMNAKLTQVNDEFAKKGQPNGYAELDEKGNLKQILTAAQVGAFPNNPGTELADFNSGAALTPGIYFFTPAATNSPLSTWGIAIVRTNDGKTYNGSSNCIWQEAYAAIGPSVQYVRSKVNTDAWGAWTKVDANRADYASNSVPLLTPALRNQIIISKDATIPTGLPDGTVVLRFVP